MIQLRSWFSTAVYMHAKKNSRSPKTRRPVVGRGGVRENSGRPIKEDKEDFVQVTCVLRKDTVEALRRGTGSKARRPQFGEFLQFHLDRFPVPSHDEYLYLTKRKPFTVKIRGRRRIPVLITQAATPSQKRPAKYTDEAFEKALADYRAKQQKR